MREPNPTRNRRGFALPFTILLTALITVMLAAAFTRVAVDVQVADSGSASVTSLSVAQAGLQAFFADTFTVRPQPGDSIRYNVTGGYAWVVPEELQRPADTVANDVMYAVRSHGVVIDPNQGATPIANRTVVQFARWQIGSISVPALFTAANGLQRQGGQPDGQLTLMGRDNNDCNTELDTLPQLRISGTNLPIIDAWSGFPPIIGGSPFSVAASTGIDWNSIVNGGFQADSNFLVLGDTITFPSQMVVGDTTITMPAIGSGLLIVTGNLTINGTGSSSQEVAWHGVILVGGYLDARAEYFDLHGLIVTGLNELLGTPVLTPSRAGGELVNDIDSDFLFEGCYVEQALRSLNGFVPVTNAIVDNWSTY